MIASAGLLLACSLQAFAAEGPEFALASESGPNDTNYVGVIGQVVRPGVYEFATPTPRLVEVIARCGGLTKVASESIRVVRNCRADQQTFYFDTSRFLTQSGDLLIVDSQPGLRRGTSGESEGVQIGLVGLIGRPVVLKVRKEDATLAGILAMLGQPRSTAGHVGIIPRLSGELPASPQFDGGPFDSGTVLCFDSAPVIRVTEWKFTEPYPIDVNTTRTVDRSSLPSAPGPEELESSARLPIDSAARTRPNGPQFLAAPPVPGTSSKSLNTASANSPQSRQAGFESAKTATNRPTRTATLSQNVKPNQPVMERDEPGPSLKTDVNQGQSSGSTFPDPSASIANEARLEMNVRPDSEQSASSGFWWFLVVMSMVLGTAALAYVGWREQAKWLPLISRAMATRSESKVEPATPLSEPRNYLEAIINNTLPLVEETIDPPTPLVFQSVSSESLHARFDWAQQVSAPHFAPVKSTVEEKQPVPVRTNHPVDVGANSHRVDAAHPGPPSGANVGPAQIRPKNGPVPNVASALEQALQRVHGGGRS